MQNGAALLKKAAEEIKFASAAGNADQLSLLFLVAYLESSTHKKSLVARSLSPVILSIIPPKRPVI
jgi:hypothetical protein